MQNNKVVNMDLIGQFIELPADVKGHGIRVSIYMQVLFDKLISVAPQLLTEKRDRPYEEIRGFVRECGVYHDLGKMMVPNSLLLKSSKLDDYEYHELQRHTEYACDMLRPIIEKAEEADREYIKDLLDVGHYHHERWDGRGYPTEKCCEDIPFFARVCAIADTYDAITSFRVYSSRNSHNSAMEEIIKNAGTQFDPDLVKVFARCERELKDINNL